MFKEIASILKNIIGKPCWNVKKGYGSFITFEFGEPKLNCYEVKRRQDNLPERHIYVRGELTDEWLLFNPSGYVLSYRNDGCYSYHPSNSSDESAIWQKIDNQITVIDDIE